MEDGGTVPAPTGGVLIENRIRHLNLGLRAVRRLRRVHGKPLSPRTGRDMAILGAWLSLFERIQRRLARKRLAAVRLSAPVFIVGHWRSGTTLLHELLCVDPAFAYPTTHACMNPQHFLWSSAGAIGGSSAAMRRPMDGMSITAGSPQEDEFALLCLGCPSPYDAVLYPNALSDILARARLDAPEQADWERCFLEFLNGVSLLGGGRRLVLKSPTHSLRIKAIARLLPDARFIHIIRDPAAVYPSTVRLWREMMASYAVGAPLAEAELRRSVRHIMVGLDDAVAEAAAGLPKERYQRIRYETLVADPLSTLADIYRGLDLGDFSQIADRVAASVAQRGDHRVAAANLDAEECQALIRDCGVLFDRHGYARPAVTILDRVARPAPDR
jgi:hypothetical protein